jgi:hypothetical protein
VTGSTIGQMNGIYARVERIQLLRLVASFPAPAAVPAPLPCTAGALLLLCFFRQNNVFAFDYCAAMADDAEVEIRMVVEDGKPKWPSSGGLCWQNACVTVSLW